MKERDEINKLCTKPSTTDLENKRRELRNKVQKEIKAAKKEYFQNVIEKDMGDGCKMWKCLKDMGVSLTTRSEQVNIGLDLENGETCFDKKSAANKFCDFFCNVGDDLVKKLKPPNELFNKMQVKSFYSETGVFETALIDLSDKIKFSMDKGLNTGMVMIDLQKAFDTVNHAIMSDKLGAIGCDDGSVKRFNSYLSNRSQFIDIKGTLSDQGEVTCGVPQGSILGPLLFLFYVNDMESAVDCDLLLYADDSALLNRGKNITDIEQKLREELTKLNVWLIDNTLSLHM